MKLDKRFRDEVNREGYSLVSSPNIGDSLDWKPFVNSLKVKLRNILEFGIVPLSGQKRKISPEICKLGHEIRDLIQIKPLFHTIRETDETEEFDLAVTKKDRFQISFDSLKEIRETFDYLNSRVPGYKSLCFEEDLIKFLEDRYTEACSHLLFTDYPVGTTLQMNIIFSLGNRWTKESEFKKLCQATHRDMHPDSGSNCTNIA